MLVDTSDLVSVTELGRGLSRYINEAASHGRRFVVLNANTPTAALVSISDLERLNALDAEPSPERSGEVQQVQLERPAQADLPARPGYSAVGRSADGEPVYWSLTGHTYAAGNPSAGTGQCFSAAIAGAVPDPDVPTEFVIATSGSHVPLRHERLHPEIPMSVEVDLRHQGRRQQFVEKLQGAIDHRVGLMRELKVETITELRQLNLGELSALVPNLVVVLADTDGIRHCREAGSDVEPVLCTVLRDGEALGIHLWFGTTELMSERTVLTQEFSRRVSHRVIVGNVETEAQSRELLGSDVATYSPVPAGIGWFKAGRGADVQLFAVTDPTGSPGDVAVASGTCQGWRPWLAQPLTLDDIPGVDPDTGPGLTFPIGASNPPWEALTLSLNDKVPHLFIAGGPESGANKALATLIVSALRRYAPSDCSFVVIDDDGRLADVAGLANVVGCARTNDDDAVERMLGEALRINAVRCARFAADALSSFDEYAESKGAGDPYGRLIVVVAGLKNVMDAHPAAMEKLLEHESPVGVHVIASVASTIRYAPYARYGQLLLQFGGTDADQLPTKELRQLVRAIPADQPGRCVDLRNERHARVAVPHPGIYRPDGVLDALRLITPLGDPLPKLEVVSTSVDGEAFWRQVVADDLPDPVGDRSDDRRPAAKVRIPLGLGIADSRIVDVPAQRSPHLVVVGSHGSGRTATVRALIESIRRLFSPDGVDPARPEAKVVVIDERGELAAETAQLADDGYLLTTDRSAMAGLEAVSAIVDNRTPSPEAMPNIQMLRNQTWYTGPEIFAVIHTPALRHQDWASLAASIAQARGDLGIHIYLSDTANGYQGRRLTQLLHKELAEAPTLLLSGPASEGVIWAGSGIRFKSRPAGRGLLVDPMSLESKTVQIPWYPEQ